MASGGRPRLEHEGVALATVLVQELLLALVHLVRGLAGQRAAGLEGEEAPRDELVGEGPAVAVVGLLLAQRLERAGVDRPARSRQGEEILGLELRSPLARRVLQLLCPVGRQAAHAERRDQGPGRGLGVEFDERRRWIVLRRGRIAIACNLGTDPAQVPATGRLLLRWGDPQVGDASTTLPGHSVAVLRAV